MVTGIAGAVHRAPLGMPRAGAAAAAGSQLEDEGRVRLAQAWSAAPGHAPAAEARLSATPAAAAAAAARPSVGHYHTATRKTGMPRLPPLSDWRGA